MPTIEELRKAMAKQNASESVVDDEQMETVAKGENTFDPRDALSDTVMQETERLYDVIDALNLSKQDTIPIGKSIFDVLNEATLTAFLASANRASMACNKYLKSLGYTASEDIDDADALSKPISLPAPLMVIRDKAKFEAFQNSFGISYDDAKQEKADFDVKPFLQSDSDSVGADEIPDLMEYAECLIRNAPVQDKEKADALMEIYQDLLRRAVLDWMVVGFDEGWRGATNLMGAGDN